jgi:hypothetical protein
MVNYQHDALSVRMKDITSDARNRAVLHRIKNNDPSLTRLYIADEDYEDEIFIVREGDNLGWLGYFIGENVTLKSLYICYHPPQEQVENFFIGLQHNKSIKEIEVDGCACDSLSSINLPYVTKMTLDVNHWESAWDEEFDHEKAHHIAVGLQRCKSLVEYWGPATAEIVASLATLPMLENVMLWRPSNEDVAIGPDECSTLRDLLTYATNMKQLDISSTRLGNEGLTSLAEGLALADGALLQDLCLDGIDISYEGWNILSDALSINNSLVSLSLKGWRDDESIIDDDGLRALALGLSHNSRLKSLNLSGNSAITASGLCSLEDYFGSPSCALERLVLRSINFGDEGAQALADALRRNSSLTTLYFSEGGITLIGWKSFLKLVCDSSSPNSLYLSNHTLCDLGDNLDPSTSHVKNDIDGWLNANNICRTPTLAAKCKILNLFPELDMVPLLKCWFCVSSENYELEARIRNNELSCIYKFIRGFPMLVGDNLRRYLTRQVRVIRTEEEDQRLMQG